MRLSTIWSQFVLPASFPTLLPYTQVSAHTRWLVLSLNTPCSYCSAPVLIYTFHLKCPSSACLLTGRTPSLCPLWSLSWLPLSPLVILHRINHPSCFHSAMFTSVLSFLLFFAFCFSSSFMHLLFLKVMSYLGTVWVTNTFHKLFYLILKTAKISTFSPHFIDEEAEIWRTLKTYLRLYIQLASDRVRIWT